MTCARRHGVITALAEVRAALPALAALGYEGAATILHIPVKKRRGQVRLSDDQHTYNKLLRGLRVIGERANALFTVTFVIRVRHRRRLCRCRGELLSPTQGKIISVDDVASLFWPG